MSVIANLSSAAAVLSQVNPHLHGHKKGSHVLSVGDTASGSDSTAKVPAGLKQNLFGSLLNSLEQVIGVQGTTPAAAATGSASTAASGATTNGSTAAAAAGAAAPVSAANAVSAAAQSSLTLLQNYLNNLLHNPRTEGPPAARLAGSNLNVTA